MRDVEHGNDSVQDMHPDAVVPHRVLPLLKRRLARDPTPLVGQFQVPHDPRRLGEVAPVRKLQGRRLAPRVHLQVRPLALVAARAHVVDDLLELVLYPRAPAHLDAFDEEVYEGALGSERIFGVPTSGGPASRAGPRATPRRDRPPASPTLGPRGRVDGGEQV